MAKTFNIEEYGKGSQTTRSSTIGVPSSQVENDDIEKSQYQEKEAELHQPPIDRNIVDWAGEDDPEKPINWPAKKKWINVMMIAGLTLLTPSGSTVVAPVVPQIMDEFHSTNPDLGSFVSLGGALLPLAGKRMFHALGYGWGNSLLGFIAFGMLPVVWIFMKYGERIRTHPKFQLNL